MGFDPFGAATASWRERAERVVREALRRVKLEAKNDPNFVPPANDASLILAARHFAVPPVIAERPANDANDLLASRVFAAFDHALSTGTPFNIPWTLVQRDANGDFEARRITLEVVIGRTAGGYELQLWAGDLTPILRTPAGTYDVELPNGSLKVKTGFGCNGKPPQTAVAAGAAAGAGSGGAGTVAGTAGATYGATEQGIINNLVSTLNAQAAIINALAAQVSANATAQNTMRTALIANGVLV